MKLRLISIFISATIFAGCSKPSDGEHELRQLLPPWFDALNLAKVSPRNSLPPQIEKMQKMRREAAAIPVSKCMEKPKQLYLDYMQSKIDILTEFLSGKDPSVIEFNRPDKDLEEFNAAVEKCDQKS